MKRIINGKTYNTDTATQVTGGDNHPYSDAWWGLYQTRHGAFFKVVQGHPWEEQEVVTPLTDEEAQAFLETHANHLVQQYFGSMPEYGAAERRLTIRVPGNLADRMEDAAKSKGLSLNSYAMRCFEQTGARTGFAAGNFGPPEVPNALPGARMGFAAGSFGTPEEAPADTVMHRPPNLVLNQSSVAGPPPQTQYDTSLPPVGPKRGSADLLTATVAGNPSALEAAPMTPEAASLVLSPTTPAMEIASAFEAMQERIRVLEIAFSRMPPPPACLGHNNPPEPIEGVPFSAAEWAEMRGLLAVLKEQVIVPTHEPQEAKAAARILKVIGEKLLSFIGRHGEEYSSELSKKLGGHTADAVKYCVLTYYGYYALKSLGTDLIGLHDHVQAWLRLLGY